MAAYPVTERIARFIDETTLDTVPSVVVDTAKTAFLDCLGVAQTETVLEDQERFLIVFDTKRGKFRLTYTDCVRWDPTDEPPKMRGEDSWYRECSPQNVLESFRKFLTQVRWIQSHSSLLDCPLLAVSGHSFHINLP